MYILCRQGFGGACTIYSLLPILTHFYAFLRVVTFTRFRFLQEISGFFRFLQRDCKGCIPLAKRVSAVFKWYFAGIPGLFPAIQFG